MLNKRPLLPLRPLGAGEFAADGVVYNLVDNQGHLEIQQMSVANTAHQLAIYLQKKRVAVDNRMSRLSTATLC